jgi:hypothetical protein
VTRVGRGRKNLLRSTGPAGSRNPKFQISDFQIAAHHFSAKPEMATRFSFLSRHSKSPDKRDPDACH